MVTNGGSKICQGAGANLLFGITLAENCMKIKKIGMGEEQSSL